MASSRPTMRRRTRTRSVGSGTLVVGTRPWSVVFAGSRRLGITPLRVSMPAGRHVLTFRAEGRPAVRQSVQIRVGEDTRLQLNL